MFLLSPIFTYSLFSYIMTVTSHSCLVGYVFKPPPAQRAKYSQSSVSIMPIANWKETYPKITLWWLTDQGMQALSFLCLYFVQKISFFFRTWNLLKVIFFYETESQKTIKKGLNLNIANRLDAPGFVRPRTPQGMFFLLLLYRNHENILSNYICDEVHERVFQTTFL